jgi:hypothetical protein
MNHYKLTMPVGKYRYRLTEKDYSSGKGTNLGSGRLVRSAECRSFPTSFHANKRTVFTDSFFIIPNSACMTIVYSQS